MKTLTVALPDDFEENRGERRSVLAFVANPDHRASKSELVIQVNRVPEHTTGIKPDHRLSWPKGLGFDHGLWWPIPAGKLKAGRKNTIEFSRVGGNDLGNVRVRAVVLWYHRMLRVPKDP